MLVITEMALALVLLVGATLLIRTFIGLRSADSGIDAHNVLTLQTSLAGSNYGSTSKVNNFIIQAVRRIEAIPGVQAAATTIALPTETEIDLPFTIAGRPPANGQQFNGDEQWRSISAHYFSVFKIPLLRGRVYSESDTANSSKVVIINQAMAKKYWPKDDALGQVDHHRKGTRSAIRRRAQAGHWNRGGCPETGLRDSGVGVMYVPQSQVPEGDDTACEQCDSFVVGHQNGNGSAQLTPGDSARDSGE